MKKIKKLLAVLSAITVIAVSSVCSVSASDLYEIPESITSIKELEEFITSPVEISAKDYVRLSNNMTEEELEEFFNSNGVSDSDADLSKTYYDGMQQVAESDCTVTIYPGGKESNEVFDVPDNITTISEFREYLIDNNIEEVVINRDDHLMLVNQLTIDELRELVAYFNMESEYISDRLVEFFRTNGIDEEEIDSYVKTYYEGALQIYEMYEVNHVSAVVNNNFSYGSPATSVELLTETSGTFESGVTYFYNEETNGLIFDGKGKLTFEETSKAFMSFPSDLSYVFYGNDVEFEPKENTGKILALSDTETVYYEYCDKTVPCVPVFTYENSGFAKTFEEYIPQEQIEKGNYVYYTVEDGTDPYTFVNPLELLPEHISAKGRIGCDDDNDVTYAMWWFDGTNEMGTFEIRVSSATTQLFDMNDILEITKDYSITKVYISSSMANMNKLPAELQGFETIEEAEAELLRLINEAKAEEQQAEAVKFGTPTIAGDIDMNGESGMADIVKLSKYTSNAELFPIEDSTALANADVTQDGVIDALDTNMLIEIALGSYENAL